MSANSELRGTRKNCLSRAVSAGLCVLSEVPLVFSIYYYSGVATPEDTLKKKGINIEINCTHRSCLGCASLLFNSQDTEEKWGPGKSQLPSGGDCDSLPPSTFFLPGGGQVKNKMIPHAKCLPLAQLKRSSQVGVGRINGPWSLPGKDPWRKPGMDLAPYTHI